MSSADAELQTIFVPSSVGVEAQTVSLGAPITSTQDGVGAVDASHGDEDLRRLMTRFVVLTDHCWGEGKSYNYYRQHKREEYLSGFERPYLEGYPSRYHEGRALRQEVELACLIGENLGVADRSLTPMEQELVDSLAKLSRLEFDPGSTAYERLTEIGEITARGELRRTSYLAEMNMEIVPASWPRRFTHGPDSCGGGKFCGPLSTMCIPRIFKRVPDHEPLKSSLRKLCDLHFSYRFVRSKEKGPEAKATDPNRSS